ncbi:hypothetical protein [Paenibacillus sp. V4I5]|uniref:hypothetical protein n=1 Tax=Paenibacillus sp. V4I5 TaxID=3042306 RepID=UPI002791AFB6|nr:hypothetical protein [Paenibacillus sp. V4I5]MDQ0917545.1 hypothetical protein [Paenibacillus sp. V4I5]
MIRISDKAITYADEFMQLFIDQYMAGSSLEKALKLTGNVNVIGIQRLKESAKRWRKAGRAISFPDNINLTSRYLSSLLLRIEPFELQKRWSLTDLYQVDKHFHYQINIDCSGILFQL